MSSDPLEGLLHHLINGSTEKPIPVKATKNKSDEEKKAFGDIPLQKMKSCIKQQDHQKIPYNRS